MEERKEEIKKKEQEWKAACVEKALKRFPLLSECPSRFYTPLDMKDDFDFIEKVGFPGQYPFTAGAYPFDPMAGLSKFAAIAPAGAATTRAALYSGYGKPEDTRDYYKSLIDRGGKQGPNLAMDLPTQCGYDSDNSLVAGEVGKVGVSIDTLRDLEVIYEPYQGDLNLDRIASNFTINAPAIYLIAMYAALAEKRGVPLNKLRATPQNDILKEYIARGTYIFPPKPAMRLFRDTLVFINEHMPHVNITSMGGYHIREAGATRVQDLAYSMANAIAYLQEGVNAGLEVDAFAPRFTFNAFGGSMEFLHEIAFQRAARRMYAKIVKERFGAKDQRSMVIRQPITAHIGPSDTTIQRPLNNLTRAVMGAVMGALSGGTAAPFPPYDEPLGLGWSLEAQQLMQDAGRILICEARLLDVEDPFAGSYCMEALTDEIEAEAWEELKKVEDLGGAVAAIEKGYMQRQIAKSAYERQKAVSSGQKLVVGVNCFTGENELEVETTRLVPHPYDPKRRERAEDEQIAALTEVKRSRDNAEVERLLKELDEQARQEAVNLAPHLVKCAKAYVTIQEVCDVLRGVFGEYEPASIL
ncbi:MAG: methylmalonyl-CoA mutase [Candidatus Abyssobacteria bacterium SURF_5]|uniref:Methylmalonyl-CoA mutase n=1 Tax=Abyssobacteria bacterium (strain SURF_5) TaxID=2093360 RepID=A0A3A4NYU0_ABYX5|nr:MAG: methylmalonyl-CoA mutase [Candidatus Abyssubacteria bacterium SURF_5]